MLKKLIIVIIFIINGDTFAVELCNDDETSVSRFIRIAINDYKKEINIYVNLETDRKPISKGAIIWDTNMISKSSFTYFEHDIPDALINKVNHYVKLERPDHIPITNVNKQWSGSTIPNDLLKKMFQEGHITQEEYQKIGAVNNYLRNVDEPLVQKEVGDILASLQSTNAATRPSYSTPDLFNEFFSNSVELDDSKAKLLPAKGAGNTTSKALPKQPDALQKYLDRYPILESDVDHSGRNYTNTIREMEKMQVGKPDGIADRKIIADVLFAKKDSVDVVATFVSRDQYILGGLLRMQYGTGEGNKMLKRIKNGEDLTSLGIKSRPIMITQDTKVKSIALVPVTIKDALGIERKVNFAYVIEKI